MADSRDRLLDAVRSRLVRFVSAGDPAPVLEPAALAETAGLTNLLATRPDDTEALITAGRLYWCRHLALGSAAGGADRDAALALFARVPAGHAELPEAARALLATRQAGQPTWQAGQPTWQAAHDRAVDLITAFETGQDRAALDRAIALLEPATAGGDTGAPAATLSLLGYALRLRYTETGRRDDLERARTAGTLAVAAAAPDGDPDGDPDLPTYLIELADAELMAFENSGDERRLAAARTAAERVRGLVPAGDPQDALATAAVAYVCCQEYERGGDPAALARAAALARSCPPERFADLPQGPVPLSALATVLWRSFEQGSDLADLRLAVHYARAAHRAVSARPDRPPEDHAGAGVTTHDRAHVVVNLSAVLTASYERTSAVDDLDEAIEASRATLAVLPPSSRFIPILCGNLCRALLSRYRHDDDVTTLNEAVEVGRRALAAAPEGHRGRLICLVNLATALAVSYETTGRRAALDEALSLTEAALAAVPPTHPEYFKLLTNYAGMSRLTGGRLDREVAVLDRAVADARAAVRAAPPGHHNRAGALAGLAIGLRARFVRTGDVAGLREAVELAREAVELTASTDVSRRYRLMMLANALESHGRRTGDRNLLRSAVLAGREALRTGAAGPAERSVDLATVAELLVSTADGENAATLTEEAEALAREAVRLCPPGLGLPPRLGTLSSVLAHRFLVTGAAAAIRESVELARRSLALLRPDSPDRPFYQHALGMRLSLLHRFTGQPEVLDEAVGLAKAAARSLPSDHPYLARSFGALGEMLGSPNALTGRRGDPVAYTGTVVELLRRALAATAPDDPAYPGRLVDLSGALRTQYEHGAARRTVHEAIDTARQALATAGGQHPARLTALGTALLQLYLRDGAPDTLDEALRVLREALRRSDNDGDRAIGQFNLGLALRARAERTGRRRVARSAIALFRQVARSPVATPLARARAAAQWGSLAVAVPDWPDAARGCELAVELLPQVAPAHLRRVHRTDHLVDFAGLAATAAAATLYDGDPRRALELLEQGRGILLGQALDALTGLDELRRLDPALAERFAWLREERDPEASLPPHLDAAARHSHAAQRRHELAGEWDDLVAGIRRRPGFERFLARPSCADLLAHATDGSIVVLNISELRSDALLLTPSGLRVVHLPDARPEAVVRAVETFLDAVAEANAPTGDSAAADATIGSVLCWLWDAVAGPVLDALGHRDRPALGARWPRVWWAPTGLLSLLPLHAAGYHAERGSPEPPTVLDRVVSSYTPTVRALAHARRRLATSAPGVPDRSLLVVSMPDTPGLPDGELPGAAAETGVLGELFPDATVLSGPDARRAAVVAALGTHSWVHFACHSRTDPLGLSESDLVLHDHAERSFTVADIGRLELPGARFAFLSACDTARADLRLPDESVHVTSAFLLAGYGSVVGTLWSIDDETAVQITRSVYTALAHGVPGRSGQAAVALHRATLRARSGQPDSPSLWAAHVHVGT